MMSDFLVRPEKFTSRTEDFGYQYLSFQLRQLTAGETYSSLTGGTELALVVKSMDFPVTVTSQVRLVELLASSSQLGHHGFEAATFIGHDLLDRSGLVWSQGQVLSEFGTEL
jgi:hypothetical protein